MNQSTPATSHTLESSASPRGDLSLRTMAMPADTNENGDIFGGWLLSQMDLAGGIFASKVAGHRVSTVAIDTMTFRKPVFVGDVVSVHTELIRVGTTSVVVRIEAWVMRRAETHAILVTEGRFTYVAIDNEGRKVPVRR
jgi:acyl-CoA thioesterase YciA